MKLSIIIPTFNSAATITACLNSIVNQSYSDKEVLIMDGGSADNTLDLIGSFISEYSFIKLYSEPDKGIYDAMNKGINKAQGEWVYFIGCDDTLFKNNTLDLLFEKQKEVMSKSDIVYGNVLFKELNIHSNYHENFDVLNFLNTNINHQSIFYRKSVFDRIGMYSLDYPVFSDWEFNVRSFFSSQFTITYISDIIAVFSLQGVSNQRSDVWIEKKEHRILSLLQNQPFYYKLKYLNNKNSKIGFFNKVKFLCNIILIKILQYTSSSRAK